MECKQCIGYGIYKEICEFKSFTEPYLWCERCEKQRRKDIDRKFKSIDKLFKNA
jgi:hypothetical protein